MSEWPRYDRGGIVRAVGDGMTDLTVTLADDECLLNREAECLRWDNYHRDAEIPPRSSRFWYCRAHDGSEVADPADSGPV